VIGWIFVLLSVGLASEVAIEQQSGHARAWTPMKRTRIVDVRREESPKDFDGILKYQWIRAFLVGITGYALLVASKRIVATDPFEAR